MTERGAALAAVDPKFGQVMIEAGPQGVLALADWLRGEGDEFRFGLGEIGYGSVRLDCAKRVPQRGAPLVFGVKGSCLVVAASASGSDFLATSLDELAAWDLGEHLHLEHYQGHPFLGEGSAPLVVTLVAGA